MKNYLKQITAGTFVLLLFLASAQSAFAAFPGQNGKLIYDMIDIDFENEIYSSSIIATDINGANNQNLLTGQWHGNGYTRTGAVRYSADGSRITYTYESDSYNLDIYTMNADGTDVQNVTNLDFENTNHFAMYSSFHPDGNQLTYGELWYEEDVWHGDIFKINSDGTSKQQLTTTNSNYCNMYPVFSPDGARIAFYRGDKVANKGSFYTMNADGSNLQKIDDAVGIEPCGGYAMGISAIDWSPDGSSLIYVSVELDSENGTLQHSIKTAASNNSGEVHTIRSSVGNNDFSPESIFMTSPQYTPEGGVIFREFGVTEASSYVKFGMMNADGSGLSYIPGVGVEGGDELTAMLAMVSYQFPTIQPLAVPQNTTTLLNAGNGAVAALTTPVGTEITCSSGISESSQSTQDDVYGYPLGLVDFCFDTTQENNEVTLTFVTDLKPHQVVARKYNTTNNSYFNIEGANITETTYNSQPALQLTYTIEDNGILDLDPAVGKIKDPVGLAVAETAGGELASTGASQQAMFIASITPMGFASWLLVVRVREYFKT